MWKLKDNKKWILAVSLPFVIIGGAIVYKNVKDSKDLNIMTTNSRSVYISAKHIYDDMSEKGFSNVDISRVLAYPAVVSSDEKELYTYTQKYLKSIKDKIKIYNLTINPIISEIGEFVGISYNTIDREIIVNKLGTVICNY